MIVDKQSPLIYPLVPELPEPPKEAVDPVDAALCLDPTKGYNQIPPSDKQLKNIFNRNPKVYKYNDKDKNPHSDGPVEDAI